MHPLESKICTVIATSGLPLSGREVVVGVSGGPDSMALLYVLASLRCRLHMALYPVYVDHGLRPEETGTEIALVRETARELGLACEVARVDTAALLRRRRLSPEQAARELRYRALNQVADRLGDGVICVGHSADDQAEEILIRLLRGSGRSGLSGMRPVSGRVVRPLLGVTRQEIMAYLGDLNVAFCQDSSNLDPRFLRNRVRHELLPFLEERFDPGIRKALLKTAASLAEDESLLETLTLDAWQRLVRREEAAEPGREAVWFLDRAGFRALPAALQRRLVEHLAWQIGSRARYAHIVAVVEAAVGGVTGSELHLSRGLRVAVERDLVRFSYPLGKGPWRGRLADKA